MDREQKTAVVKELAAELEGADAIFAVDYRGISVPQAAELREGLRDADARFRVVKNRLTLRAADEAGTESLKEFLEGPTALTFVKGDAALAAKTIFRLGSEWELLAYKGGLMNDESVDPDSFKAIARLPGREQLNAQFAGIVASPLTGLVRGLGSMIQGLAVQLGQIAEKGLVTGEESPTDPEPSESPEDDARARDSATRDTEEQAPEGEDAGQGEAAETGEGDQDLGEEPAESGTDEPAEQEQTSEDSENKEESE
jgi:large subunit ribosomal protein L10